MDQNVTGDLAQNTEPLHIGDGNDERHWNGAIDEVRIYDRGLSEAEVKQNFEIDSNLLAVEPMNKLASTWGKIKAAQ